ncbi:hypothetical protein [Psychroserpens jangbogonensis]|uniref:hypothetical protein n=1 Tax=Psychroserpens jangbogonensis TaxID=1484460 RepID=UPI000A7C192A|nr:hypothetical protein [Psychroserpens jangbogonensis]
MQTKNKNFQFLKALDCTTVLLLVLFVALFIKTIMAVINSLQSEMYTNYVAGLSSF